MGILDDQMRPDSTFVRHAVLEKVRCRVHRSVARSSFLRAANLSVEIDYLADAIVIALEGYVLGRRQPPVVRRTRRTEPGHVETEERWDREYRFPASLWDHIKESLGFSPAPDAKPKPDGLDDDAIAAAARSWVAVARGRIRSFFLVRYVVVPVLITKIHRHVHEVAEERHEEVRVCPHLNVAVDGPQQYVHLQHLMGSEQG